jgi:MYXO-CTERM domain-containing protein
LELEALMKTKHALAALTIAGLSLSASSAFANFHLMTVAEVGLSKGGDTTAQFIELQDTASEPFPAGTYDLTIYDASNVQIGGSIALVNTALQAGQTAYLISTASADAKFGVTGNTVLNVALPANGQACFRNAGANVHCLAWGTVATPQTGASTGASPPDDGSLQRQANGTYAIAIPTPKAANGVPVLDGGTTDGGATDGGTTDAGPKTDGGTTADSGTTTDSGTPGTDSGTNPGIDSGTSGGDGGSVDPETPAEDDSGCSVATIGNDAASTSILFTVGALGLVAVARRRKKR